MNCRSQGVPSVGIREGVGWKDGGRVGWKVEAPKIEITEGLLLMVSKCVTEPEQ